MGTINPPIPDLGAEGPGPAQDLIDSLADIRDELNGLIAAVNLKDKGIDEAPVETWEQVKLEPNLKLMAGPYTAGFGPEFKFGEQIIGAGPAPAASNVLREIVVILKWTKSAKFTGGNAPDNELVITTFNDASTGEPAEQKLGIYVPGTDGLRNAYKSGFVTLTPTLVDVSLVNMVNADNGQQIIMPDIGDQISVRATGPLTGAYFIIHEMLIRYRDWEF